MICSLPLSWPYSPSIPIIQGVNQITMCLISCIFRPQVFFLTYHFLTLTDLAPHPLLQALTMCILPYPLNQWGFPMSFFQWIVEFLIFSFILAWVFFSISTALLNLLHILKYCFYFIQSFVFSWTSVRALFPSCLSLFKSLFEHACNYSFKFLFI